MHLNACLLTANKHQKKKVAPPCTVMIMDVAVMCSSGSAPLEDSADMSGTGSVPASVSERYQTIPLPESQAHFPGQPYSVSVLKVGYCLPQPDGTFRADGTITLITGPKTILVDTGGPWDRDFLLMSLKERGLEPGDINLVVGTHGHSDHIGNLGLFQTALTIVGYDISEGDTYRPNRLAQGHAYTVDEHIYVVPSPGHTGQDVSVQVNGTSAGTVLVAGDLFECCSDGDSWRELSLNTAVQEVSRQRALRTADVIIPGHGPPFRVLRNQ